MGVRGRQVDNIAGCGLLGFRVYRALEALVPYIVGTWRDRVRVVRS